jgi:hypothetical protein
MEDKDVSLPMQDIRAPRPTHVFTPDGVAHPMRYSFSSQDVGGAKPTHVLTPDGIYHPYRGLKIPNQVKAEPNPETGELEYKISADLIPVRLHDQYLGKTGTLRNTDVNKARDLFYGPVPHSERIYGAVEEAYVRNMTTEEYLASSSKSFKSKGRSYRYGPKPYSWRLIISLLVLLGIALGLYHSFPNLRYWLMLPCILLGFFLIASIIPFFFWTFRRIIEKNKRSKLPRSAR